MPKKKKKIRKKTTDPKQILTEAEAMVAQNRYIRAREGFKRLYKLNPEEHRKRFIEITSLAVDEALAQNKTNLPTQWLEHMRDGLKMTSGELQGIELKINAFEGNELASTALAHELIVSDLEGDRRHAADALVLAKAPEAQPISQAIHYLCHHQWEEAARELEVIGRKSPFSHWRLFLKGCLAYYQGRKEEGEQCFSRLPQGTVPAKKAKAFGRWRWDMSVHPTPSDLFEAGALSGEAKLASNLEKAHFFWRRGQCFKAYETLQSSGESFPSCNVNLSGQLTQFFQFAHFNLQGRMLENWFNNVKRATLSKRHKRPADRRSLYNILIQNHDSDRAHVWDQYLAARESCCGKDKRFQAALHYLHALSEYKIECPCEVCLQNVYPYAKEILEKAIEADEAYFPPYEELLKVYRNLNEPSKRNKLLDKMAALFPDSETTLVEAGQECINRKSYAKAITFLKKAQKLSPLNPKIGESLRWALELKSLAHYKKGQQQWERGRECFEDMIQNSKETWQDGFRIDVIGLIKWATIERLLLSEGMSKHEAILKALPEIDPHLLEFIEFVYRIDYQRRLKMRIFAKKVDFTNLPGGNTPQQALEILKFFVKIYLPTTMDKILVALTNAANDYLASSIKKLQIADRAIAIDLFELLDNDGAHYWQDSVEQLAEQWLRIDKDDPLFRLWKCRHAWDEPSEKDIKKIRVEAQKRNDSKALQEIEKLSTSLEDDFGNGNDDESGLPLPPDDSMAKMDMMMDILAELNERERIEILQKSGMSRSQAITISKALDLELEQSRADGASNDIRQLGNELIQDKDIKSISPKKQVKPKLDPFHEHPELPF